MQRQCAEKRFCTQSIFHRRIETKQDGHELDVVSNSMKVFAPCHGTSHRRKALQNFCERKFLSIFFAFLQIVKIVFMSPWFLVEKNKKQTFPRCIIIHFNFVSLEFFELFMKALKLSFMNWIKFRFFYCVCLRLASIFIDIFGSCINLSS